MNIIVFLTTFMLVASSAQETSNLEQAKSLAAEQNYSEAYTAFANIPLVDIQKDSKAIYWYSLSIVMTMSVEQFDNKKFITDKDAILVGWAVHYLDKCRKLIENKGEDGEKISLIINAGNATLAAYYEHIGNGASGIIICPEMPSE